MPHEGGSSIGFAPVGPRPAPTGDSQASWANIVNGMLHAIWTNTGRGGGALSADERRRIENGLVRVSTEFAEQFLPLQSAMAAEFGFVTPDDVVYLDLKAGDNELLFVVSEVFGGWGFLARREEVMVRMR